MENKKLTITFIDPDPIPSWLSHYEDEDEEDQESFSRITEAVEKFNDFLELHSCEKNNFHVPEWLPKVLGLQIQNAFVTVSTHEWRDWNYLYTYVFEIPETHEFDFSLFESIMNNFDYFDGYTIGQHGQDGWYGGYEIVDSTELASALNPGEGWWHYVYKVDPPSFEGVQINLPGYWISRQRLDWHEATEYNILVWDCKKPDEFNF